MGLCNFPQKNSVLFFSVITMRACMELYPRDKGNPMLRPLWLLSSRRCIRSLMQQHAQ